MKETQETVGKWIDETFPGTDPNSPRKALRALEEMVELCLASGASAEDIEHIVGEASIKARKESGQKYQERKLEPDKIRLETADVLIVLYGVAHMRGFDLHLAVDDKMAINRHRQWKPNGDGTGYHVKQCCTGVIDLI